MIELSDADVDRLSGNWRMQKSKPLPRNCRTSLSDSYKMKCIFASHLGLDVNDAIIRRRLVQKLTFLTEDIASIQPLNAAEIQKFFDENIEAC